MNKSYLILSLESFYLLFGPMCPKWRRDSIEDQQCQVACIFPNNGELNPTTNPTVTANEKMGFWEGGRRLFLAPNLLDPVTRSIEYFLSCLARRLGHMFLQGKNHALPHLFSLSLGQCLTQSSHYQNPEKKIFLWISDDCRGNI